MGLTQAAVDLRRRELSSSELEALGAAGLCARASATRCARSRSSLKSSSSPNSFGGQCGVQSPDVGILKGARPAEFSTAMEPPFLVDDRPNERVGVACGFDRSEGVFFAGATRASRP